MKLLHSALLWVLLLTLPLSAAEPFYGVWKMRPSGGPGATSKQTITIEPVADGIKFTTDIDFGSGAGGMSMTYVTKLDGAEVPLYSAGKVVIKVGGKSTGPNTYERPVPGPVPSHPLQKTLPAERKNQTGACPTAPHDVP